MNRGDVLVERAAGALEQTAQRLAPEGGVKRQIAEILAEDAAFLRRMKPSLVRARMKGEAPTNGTGPHPAGLMHFGDAETKPKQPKPPGEGPNPLLVVGAAFAVGVVLAKVIDWRGHAHPRL